MFHFFLMWNSYQENKHAISSLKFKRKIFVTEEKEDMNLKEQWGGVGHLGLGTGRGRDRRCNYIIILENINVI